MSQAATYLLPDRDHVFTTGARRTAIGLAMFIAAALPLRAEAQVRMKLEDILPPVRPNRVLLKVVEMNETRETRSRQYSHISHDGRLSQIAFDSVVAGPGDSLTYFNDGESPNLPWRMVRDGTGRSRLVAAGERRPSPNKSRIEADSLSMRPQIEVSFSTPATPRMLLEQAAMFEGAPTTGTVRSTDVRHKWDSLDLRLEFTGRRSSTRLRDSVAPDGGRYAIVRDQATFSIVEVRSQGDDYAVGALRYRDTIRATRTGTRIVSMATGRAVVMWDTTAYTGRHVRRDIDGIDLPSRSEVRQTRHLRWQTDADERAKMLALTEGPRPGFAADSYPLHPMLERMRRRDTKLRDSLVAALATTLSFNERDGAISLLEYVPDSLLSRRWHDSVALAAGDTSWIVHRFLDEPQGDTIAVDTITAQRWRLIAPYLRDRRWAWDRGIDSWALGDRLIDVLSKAPPAFTDNRESWACDSITCESIAREYQPTRAKVVAPASQVGLAMRALLRPAPWADTVLAHESDALLLRELRTEMLGVRYLLGDQFPAPDLNAPWRDWMRWKWGIRSDLPVDPVREAGSFRLFEDDYGGRSAAQVLRWREARTGIANDPVLSARYAAAVNDSERVVYAKMLDDLDLLRDSLMQVSRMLSSGKAASRLIGRMQVERLRKSAIAPDSITMAEIHLIALNNFTTATRTTCGPPTLRFLESAHATPSDSVRLAQAGITLVPPTWRHPEGRSTCKTHVSIHQLGPLAWVTYDTSTLVVRPNGGRFPSTSGQRVAMHRTLDGWHVVSERFWNN